MKKCREIKYLPTKEHTWNVDITFAIIAIRLLRKFKKYVCRFPPELKTMDNWHKIIDKMILAFTIICDENKFMERYSDERVKEGLALFKQYYADLWW